MAHKITEECTYCGACQPECPVEAIDAGEEVYIIDQSKCVDCKGHYESPACVAVCPADCIVKA